MKKERSAITTREDLRESILGKYIFPLYFFFGNEDFLIDEIVGLLIDNVLDNSARSFNYDVVDAGDAKDVINLVTAFPVQSDYRVVILKDFEKIEDRERLIPLFEKPMPSTVLVIRAEKRDMRMNVYKVLQRNAVVVEFKQLFENQITAWILDRVKKKGKVISAETGDLMQSYIGRSLREINNELEKLFIYVGNRQNIDTDDVNSAVGLSKEYNIFELRKAVGKKDLPNTLKIIDRMVSAGKSPTDIIRTLTKYFLQVWVIQNLLSKKYSDDKIIETFKFKKSNMSEYRIASRLYSESDLENCFKMLLEADEALKSSRPHDVVLPVLSYSIIRGKQKSFSYR